MLKIMNDTRNKVLTWAQIKKLQKIRLYAGDIPDIPFYNDLIGLSIRKTDHRHILHNILEPYPLENNSVALFQSEDVFEHIQFAKLNNIINEIYRILRPGALFRLSVPDYRCDILKNRSNKDKSGNIFFDPFGGGTVDNPGHVWFPVIENVRELLSNSCFINKAKINFLHYYDTDKSFVLKPIDYSEVYIQRTPDNDERVKNPRRPMSIVVDLIKD